MKASNKILIGIFLLPLLILACINIALYAKYKAGHYVIMKGIEEDRFLHYPLPVINHVAVYGVNNFTILHSDTAKLDMEKDQDNSLRYQVKGDSLIIHGEVKRAANDNHETTGRSYQDVHAYLPGSVTLSLFNSDGYLMGTKDSNTARSYQVQLKGGCSLSLGNTDRNDLGYFGKIGISSLASDKIELAEQTHVADLTLVLRGSVLNDHGAAVNSIAIAADSASNITLTGNNLKNLHNTQ